MIETTSQLDRLIRYWPLLSSSPRCKTDIQRKKNKQLIEMEALHSLLLYFKSL
jgi:hypothetical protein